MAYDTDEIKKTVDIVEVVGHYVPLKKKGNEYVGLCPFHADKNPSFYVNRRKAMAHCFGCGAHHDVISFLQEKEGLDFKAACERLGGKNDWTPSLSTPAAPPAPERITSKPPVDAPAPSMALSSLGEPVKIFPLRDLDGAIICYEARYDDPNDKSRMWTWGARPGQKPRWACGHYNQPRPLYGLDRIAKFPEGTKVCITEGPKKADAAQRIFGEHYTCLSWTGGAGAMDKHDWSNLAGMDVLLWPDADRQICKSEREAVKYGCAVGDVIPYEFQPGQAAMFRLAETLLKMGCKVRIINVESMPGGWDIADAEEEGWELHRVIEWASPRASDYKPNPPAPVKRDDDEPPAYFTDLAPLPEDSEIPPQPNPRVVEPKKTQRSVTQNHYVPPELPPGSHEARLKSLVLIRGSEIQIKPIKWLWPGRIAKGKVSLIVGDPGLGKSQVCASLTSIVTNGGTWPADRTPCGDPGSVVILSAEDDPEDTIGPRLIAAGADMDKVYLLQAVRFASDNGEDNFRAFSVSDDLNRLMALLDHIGDVRMIIIDPISAYMGSADSHKNSEVRGMLVPLSNLAAQRNFAVILVSHLTKNQSSSALMRVQGSIALPAAARSVWGVTKDPDNPSRRLFMPLKNNIGNDETGLAYTIDTYEIRSDEDEEPVKTSCVMWENEIIDMKTDEAFGNDDEREEKNDASSFIRSLLADGKMTTKAVEAEARGAGYSMSLLRKVANKIGVIMEKEAKFKGQWYWSLPDNNPGRHTVH